MIELSALERKKLTGRRSSRDMMKVIAAMWQAEKKSRIEEPTFHLDSNMIISFW